MTLKLCLASWGRLSEIDKEWWQLLQSSPSWQTLYFFQSSRVFLLLNECIQSMYSFTPTPEAQKQTKKFAWKKSRLSRRFPDCLECFFNIVWTVSRLTNLFLFIKNIYDTFFSILFTFVKEILEEITQPLIPFRQWRVTF